MHPRLASKGVAFCLLFICLSVPSNQTFAQAGQGELTGEIRDAIGALVARATVTVTQIDTGEIVIATTGKGGTSTVTNSDIKRTYFGEARNLKFRTEIFKLTNTPPLTNPNGVVGNAAFGTITSAGDPRVIQFGLKL